MISRILRVYSKVVKNISTFLEWVVESIWFVFQILFLNSHRRSVSSLSPASRQLRFLLHGAILMFAFSWIISRSPFASIFSQLRGDLNVALFSPSSDISYFEHFQYIMLLWIAMLLIKIKRSNNLPATFFIPYLWMWLFADDMFRLHDGLVSNYLLGIYSAIGADEYILFLRAKDVAELSYWLLLLPPLVILSLILNSSGSLISKSIFAYNLRILFVLSLFGIGVDIFSPMINGGFLINGFLTFLEEFGEILVVASGCIFHYELTVRKDLKSYLESCFPTR